MVYPKIKQNRNANSFFLDYKNMTKSNKFWS